MGCATTGHILNNMNIINEVIYQVTTHLTLILTINLTINQHVTDARDHLALSHRSYAGMCAQLSRNGFNTERKKTNDPNIYFPVQKAHKYYEY